MILPQSYSAVLFLMILSLLCLGSWASAYKFSGTWRFELFYFDFALGLLVAAVIYAFTLGNIGYDGFNLIDDLQHAGKRQVMYALMAGILFNLGNMLLMAAVSVAGMAVAFPMTMGVALVLGIGLGLVGLPTGNTLLLGLGSALILTSVLVNAALYRMRGVERHEALARSGRAKSTRRPNPVKGIILACVGGIPMGIFPPLLDKARVEDVGLGPYALAAIFAFGVFASSLPLNIFFMNLPVEGEPVDLGAFLKGRVKQHGLGVAAGFVWCTGILAAMVSSSVPEQLQPAQVPRYMLLHGAPVLAALWGILVFGELKSHDVRMKALGALMLVLFLCGLVMIGMAPLFLRQV